jgi:WD40 repeat protein
LTRRVERGGLDEPRRAVIAAYPTALAWSADGKRLAIAGDDGSVELLDAATGQVRQQLRAHAGPVQSIAWHPGRDALLTTGQDGAARLWDSPFEISTELLGPSASWADHACWSATGDRAAVALAARAHVFSPGLATASTEPVGSTIAGLAFTPSGKSLGAACYGGVRLFDPATGRITPWLLTALRIVIGTSSIAVGVKTGLDALR